MKEFKIFEVYSDRDKEKMEDIISQYLSEHWILEKCESTIKRDLESLEYKEYQVIFKEPGD